MKCKKKSIRQTIELKKMKKNRSLSIKTTLLDNVKSRIDINISKLNLIYIET